jgi:hypothetical protein
MKNTTKLFGLIALAALIGLSFTGCSDSGPSASTCTVTFNADGGAPAPQPQTVAKGGTITQPEAMTKGAAVFGGWYREAAFINLWNFASDTVTRDITLYAKWTGNSGLYTVTFNANGGAPAPQPQTVAEGGTVTRPGEMSKGDSAFGGWYKEAAFINLWNFASDTVSGPTALYAKWSAPTEGLFYTLLGSGNAYSVSRGTASAADVVIPNFHEGLPVTEIEANGFSNYTNMASVMIPDRITNIGNYAFYNCSSLASVIIPNSVISIGSSVLSGCSGLTSVTLPFLGSSLNSSYSNHIGYIFGAASYSGQNANIPASLKTVSIININNNTLQSNVFSGCTGLESVITPGGAAALSGWSVTLPNNVVSIASSAFLNCSGLKSVTIPAGVIEIGSSAFSGCSSLTDIALSAGITSISSNTFQNCASLTDITIPDSVTSIGSSVFSGCSSLESITIPFVGNTLNGVSNTSFSYIFGYDVSSVPSSLKTAVIRGGSIAASAFKNCSGLEDITITGGITEIGGWAYNVRAFEGCTGLKSVTIGNSVTSIGDYAFYNCSGLASVTIPNSVTSIGDYAFYNCSGLASVTIPNSVMSIGGSAFGGCSGLASVTIPNSVTSIGGSAFRGCSGLENITVASGNTAYRSEGNCLISIADNELILGCKASVIPESVMSIGGSAFGGCSGLASVTIPNSVMSIGGFAFGGCTGLASVTIPNSVMSIGSEAFYGCTGLASVTFEGTIPSSGFTNYFTFPGDLRSKFYATDSTNGTPGTYTTTNPGDYYSTWTKQP